MFNVRRFRWLLLSVLLLAACGAPSATQQQATAPASKAPDAAAEVQPTAASTEAAAETEPTPADNAAAPSGDKVELTLWIFEGEEEFLPRLKEAFEAKHPNITLQLTEIPEDQYVTKIDTALAANDPPDIGFVYGGQQRWLKTGKFLPLDDLFAERQILPADFNQGAMSYYCLFEGKNYCIGSYTGAVVLLYNKAMFDAAGVPHPSPTEPMTIAEYVATAAKLTKKDEDIAKRVWGGQSDVTWWWADWRTHFSEDGKKAEGFINDDATVNAYNDLAQMAKDGSAPSSSEMDMLGDADVFVQGKQAMIFGDTLAVTRLEDQKVAYGAAPMPVETQGDLPWVTTWTDAFGVFTESDHPEEAREFVAFLGTEGNRIRNELGVLPLNMTMAEELNWAQGNPGRAEMLQAVNQARASVFVPGVYEIMDPMGDAYNAIVEGDMTAKEALDDAAVQIQESLDKNWETWEQIK